MLQVACTSVLSREKLQVACTSVCVHTESNGHLLEKVQHGGEMGLDHRGQPTPARALGRQHAGNGYHQVTDLLGGSHTADR